MYVYAKNKLIKLGTEIRGLYRRRNHSGDERLHCLKDSGFVPSIRQSINKNMICRPPAAKLNIFFYVLVVEGGGDEPEFIGTFSWTIKSLEDAFMHSLLSF